jgi:glycerophosphoryl diester phosphodiesterase
MKLLNGFLKIKKKFILEVKDEAVLEPLSQLLKSNSHIKDLFIVASFDAVFLERFKNYNPDIKTCLILGNVLKTNHIVQLLKDIKANFLIPAWENRHPYPDQLLSDDLIKKLNSENIKIISWHEERKEILEKLIEKPIYAISTNNPLLITRKNKKR